MHISERPAGSVDGLLNFGSANKIENYSFPAKRFEPPAVASLWRGLSGKRARRSSQSGGGPSSRPTLLSTQPRMTLSLELGVGQGAGQKHVGNDTVASVLIKSEASLGAVDQLQSGPRIGQAAFLAGRGWCQPARVGDGY